MVFKKVLKFIGFSFADLASAKKFIVLFLCVFSFSTFGNISGTELIDDLRNSGNLGIFDSPTINVFEEHCSDMSFSSLNDASKTFCEAVVSSEVCQSVEKKDLMNCNQYENSTDFHGGRFLLGCLKGVVIDAPIALMKFVWETLKWVWDTGTHPVETYQEASEYIESAKLYLATEYDKAYDRSSRPFRRTKAVSAVSGAVSNMFIKSIQDYLSAEYKEFGCLSFQARTNRVCKIIAEIGIPVGAIKLGPKGIKALMAKKGKKGGANLVDGDLIERKRFGETSLSRELNTQQVEALQRAHLVGKGQIGKDGTPARIGNYTSAQLRDKIKILRDAGFSRAERRKLMKDGVVGILGKGKVFKSPIYLEMTGDPRVDRFREALNSGKVPEGDDRYVAYTDASGKQMVGEITDVQKNTLSFQSKNEKLQMCKKIHYHSKVKMEP